MACGSSLPRLQQPDICTNHGHQEFSPLSHIPISLRCVLILSCSVRLGISSVSLFQVFRQETFKHFSSCHAYYMPHPSNPNSTWRRKVTNLLVNQLSFSVCYFLPLRPKYQPTIAFPCISPSPNKDNVVHVHIIQTRVGGSLDSRFLNAGTRQRLAAKIFS